MEIDIELLERATLDAVGPAEIGALPGWLLPFDNSTVGRAISAVPLRHADLDPTMIAEIELRYTQRGLKTQFRIADVPGLMNLQQGLLSRGYTAQQPTLTLTGTVGQWPGVLPGHDVQLSLQPTKAWASVYTSGDFDPVDGANRVRALSRGKCLVYASLSDASGEIAAGTASFSQGWASLHGLRTVAHARGKGCASAVIAALGHESRKKKVERCFLQVEEGNAPAINLYRSLGFQTAWLYHYWRRAP
jgi:ribosomal protein S18 acetylase RimI-like enzyme